MSSGDSRTTSSSSRLSQFGLYRTIDARTEEFLRLSRKRQIRQGCACAAVSTAITVAVVITVILVYEYTVSVDSSINQKLRKPTWHGLFNDTSPFEAKYNKAKINIDPVTLKLLPVILKAINRNKHLDTIEDSSSNLASDKETTESTFKIKVASSLFRGNTNTEHKAPPVVRFKNLFTNSDYFKKIRHTKDYKRMLEYFNKMIYGKTHGISLDAEMKPDKITMRTTTQKNNVRKKILLADINVSPKLIENNTDNTLSFKNLLLTSSGPNKKMSQLSIPIKLRDTSTVKITTTVKKTRDVTFGSKHLHKPTVKKSDNAIPCKCNDRVVNLLKKLIGDIKIIIPEIEFYQPQCTKNTNTTTSRSTVSTTTIKTASTTAASLSDNIPQFTFAPEKNWLNQIFKSTSHLSNNYLSKEEDVKNGSGLPAFFLEPFDEIKYDNFDTFVRTTTAKYSIEPTEAKNKIKLTTSPMSKKYNAKTIRLTQSQNKTKHTSVLNTLTPKNKTEYFVKNVTEIYGAGKVTNDNLNKNKQNTISNGYNVERLLNQTRSNASSYLRRGLEHRIPLRKEGKLAKNYKINEDKETPISPIFKTKSTKWKNSKFKNNSDNLSKSKMFNTTKFNHTEISLNRIHKYDSEYVSENPSHFKENTGATTTSNWLLVKNYETGSNTFKNQETIMLTALQDSTVTYFENYGNDNVITPERWTTINVVPKAKNYTSFDEEPAIENYAHETYNDFNDNFLNHTEPYETNFSLQSVNNTDVISNQSNEKITHQLFDYDDFKFLEEEERDTPEEVTNTATTDKYPIGSGAQTEKNTHIHKFLNSMLPISRPTYLEYHRNNWKLYNADYTNTDNGFDIV